MTELEIHQRGAAVDRSDVSTLAVEVAAAQARAEALAARDGDLETAGLAPEARRAALNEMRNELDDAREHLQRVTDELQAAFAAQLEATRSALAPLQEKAAKLNSAVEAISLYLGSDEQIVILREGDAPPPATPITVYQDVLYMDEEMALAAEAAGIADATIDPGEKGWASFDEWLLADDDHVNQVCPTERGIVALRSARQNRSAERYGRPAADGSEITHFLVRNGENLTWVIASVEFEVGDRLVPLRDEFDSYYTDRWNRDEHGNPERLTPGSVGWDRASAAADRAQRHYMKIALILQGIVDRSTLLSPLPAETVSFTRVEDYDAGHITVATSDNALPSGIIGYETWRRRIIEDLDRGQRVVFGHISHLDLYGGRDHGPGCVHPRTADGPPTGVPLEVKRRDGDRWVVSYPRTDEVWRTDIPVEDRPGWVRSGYAPAKGHASIRFYGEERWVLPIDHPLVTVEALEWYLTSRENRRHFSHMIPLLRSALRALHAEAALEAPFRSLAINAVTTTQADVDTERATQLVDDAISWYKTKNRRHRALLADGTDTSAYEAVLAAVDARLAAEDRPDDPAILANIEATCSDAMYIGRRPDGTYIAITAADDRDVYVHIDTFSAKQGRRGRRSEWVTAPDVRLNKTIRCTKRFDAWPRHVDTTSEATGPELDTIISEIRSAQPGCVAIDTYQYWSWNHGSATGYRAWAPGADPVIDDDRPLTGDNTAGRIGATTYRWARDRDGNVTVRDADLTDRSAIVDSVEMQLDSGGDTIWIDATALETAWAQRWEPWAEHAARRRALAAPARAAEESLAEAWQQRAIETEWASFVAKYGTEAKGRWETRLKAIERRLQFPHRHHVRHSIELAAEAGLLDAGTTITYGELLDALAGDPEVPDTVAADCAELTIITTTTADTASDTDDD